MRIQSRTTEDKVIDVLRYVCGVLGGIWAISLVANGLAMLGVISWEGSPSHDMATGIIQILEAFILLVLAITATAIYSHQIEAHESFISRYLRYWYSLYVIRKAGAPSKELDSEIDEILSVLSDDEITYIRSFSGDSDEDFNGNLLKFKEESRPTSQETKEAIRRFQAETKQECQALTFPDTLSILR